MHGGFDGKTYATRDLAMEALLAYLRTGPDEEIFPRYAAVDVPIKGSAEPVKK